MRGIIIGGITLFLLFSCSGQLEAEKLAAENKNTFFESIIKIGQGFQEIFGIFGNAMGEALGFSAVKSTDNRSAVGAHFDKIGKGLKDTKDKLDGLAKDIDSTPHANTKEVEAVISSASGVLAKLMESLTKLAGITNAGVNIGDNHTRAAVATPATDVEAIIKEVKAIIETATSSGIKIDKGTEGSKVDAGDNTAPDVLVGTSAGANAAAKLADEVVKSDPWAMIDKIKDATTKSGGGEIGAGDHKAGILATGTAAGDNVAAKTNADLAAAVALKAMTKTGKFSVTAADAVGVKAAAATAVNKVLGVLDEIIRRTVNLELGKIKDAVNRIQYSEIAGETAEAGTTQTTSAK